MFRPLKWIYRVNTGLPEGADIVDCAKQGG